MFPWSSWNTLLPLLLGIAGMVSLAYYEIYVAREPVIRFAIFRSRTAIVTYFGTFVHGIVLWCLLYFLPLYYEAVKDYTPTVAGIAALPETFTVAPASIVVGVAISMSGRFRWAIWCGWFLSVLGMGLLYMLGPETSIPAWVFLNLVPGTGLGMLYSSLGYGTQASADQTDVAFAAAMYTFSRSLGQSVGVAIGGAVFQTQLETKLSSYPALVANATSLARDASSLVQIIKAIPKDQPVRSMLINSFADSLKVVWAVMAGLAFVALLASSMTEGLIIDQPQVTEQGLSEEKSSSPHDSSHS